MNVFVTQDFHGVHPKLSAEETAQQFLTLTQLKSQSTPLNVYALQATFGVQRLISA